MWTILPSRKLAKTATGDAASTPLPLPRYQEPTKKHHDLAHREGVVDLGAEYVPRVAEISYVHLGSIVAPIHTTRAELCQE